MKLREIINTVGAFTKLANAEMSLRSAYRLKKLVDSVQSEIDFFNEKNQLIAEKYSTARDGNSNGNGNGVIPESKLAVAQAELDELLNLDVHTEFTPVSLPLTENVCISANDITVLSAFITFDDNLSDEGRGG